MSTSDGSIPTSWCANTGVMSEHGGALCTPQAADVAKKEDADDRCDISKLIAYLDEKNAIILEETDRKVEKQLEFVEAGMRFLQSLLSPKEDRKRLRWLPTKPIALSNQDKDVLVTPSKEKIEECEAQRRDLPMKTDVDLRRDIVALDTFESLTDRFIIDAGDYDLIVDKLKELRISMRTIQDWNEIRDLKEIQDLKELR
ncbi:MAG: hypothetical protein SGARI_004746, partial [Bacillariaceae sp.]